MKATAVLRFREKAGFHQVIDRANYGSAALADEMRNPIEARIALRGAKIEAVDDGSRDLLLRARQHVGEADRLESERYVEPLWAHFLSMKQVILLLTCSQAAPQIEIVKIAPGRSLW